MVSGATLVVGLVALLALLPAAAAQGLAAEGAALRRFYTGFDGPSWRKAQHWMSSKGHCTWEGITCNYEEHVTRIRLVNNNLRGSLPAGVDALPELRELTLTGNAVHGTLPEQLRHLTRLQVLGISRNQLSGSLPEWIAELRSLRQLILSYNSLVSLPDHVGTLKNITEFNVYGNQLRGTLPEELGDLPRMRNLYLIMNHLEGSIPRSFARLSRLERLALAENRLSGVFPAFVPALPKLDYVSTGHNLWTCPLPAFRPKQHRDPPLSFCLDAAPRPPGRPIELVVRGYDFREADRWHVLPGAEAKCGRPATPVTLRDNATAVLRLPEGLPAGVHSLCYYRSHVYYRGWPFPGLVITKVAIFEVTAADEAAPPPVAAVGAPHHAADGDSDPGARHAADDAAVPLPPPKTAPAAAVPVFVASCFSRVDCSGHGRCLYGACDCDARWTGPRCADCRPLLPLAVDCRLRASPFALPLVALAVAVAVAFRCSAQWRLDRRAKGL